VQNQTADVTWKENGVPVSTRFDDPYFSLDNGLAETRHVFLQGNDLPDRFRDGFEVAELGFGTGLNFLTTLTAWRAAGRDGHLHFTSFEAFPMTADDLAVALSMFDELRPLADRLVAQWAPRGGTIDMGEDVILEVVIGDARDQLPRWTGQAHAWFLDGFSPAKNPELWSPALMQEVGRHTRAGGTFATYTAAGFVRRGLTDAGFEVERVPGFGRKRHMTRGVKRA
jgi:tRNA U34 5-methylaminomethyl-2-thiouridine-forming methyltransferase MnmC